MWFLWGVRISSFLGHGLILNANYISVLFTAICWCETVKLISAVSEFSVSFCKESHAFFVLRFSLFASLVVYFGTSKWVSAQMCVALYNRLNIEPWIEFTTIVWIEVVQLLFFQSDTIKPLEKERQFNYMTQLNGSIKRPVQLKKIILNLFSLVPYSLPISSVSHTDGKKMHI